MVDDREKERSEKERKDIDHEEAVSSTRTRFGCCTVTGDVLACDVAVVVALFMLFASTVALKVLLELVVGAMGTTIMEAIEVATEVAIGGEVTTVVAAGVVALLVTTRGVIGSALRFKAGDDGITESGM